MKERKNCPVLSWLSTQEYFYSLASPFKTVIQFFFSSSFFLSVILWYCLCNVLHWSQCGLSVALYILWIFSKHRIATVEQQSATIPFSSHNGITPHSLYLIFSYYMFALCNELLTCPLHKGLCVPLIILKELGHSQKDWSYCRWQVRGPQLCPPGGERYVQSCSMSFSACLPLSHPPLSAPASQESKICLIVFLCTDTHLTSPTVSVSLSGFVIDLFIMAQQMFALYWNSQIIQ